MSRIKLSVIGPALIVDTVPPEKTGLAMSCISINLSLGLTLGPLSGGTVYARAGWYGIFGLGLSVLLIDIFLRLLILEKNVVQELESQTDQDKFNDTETDIEQPGQILTTKEPMRKQKLPDVVALLRIPRLLAALWLTFIQAIVISAFDTVLPLHLNQLFGWTSLQAGLW